MRIDTHHHPIFDAYTKPLASIGITGPGPRDFPEWSPESALNVMERHEIDATVMSIGAPGSFFGDINFTRALVRSCNEALAQIKADHSGKFAALGLVSLPDADRAARDVTYALDELGLDGIGLVSHYGDQYLGDPAFDAFYAAADELGAVVFFHPAFPRYIAGLNLLYPPVFTDGEIDSTRALLNLLASGTLEKFPNIKWYMPHAGGALWSQLSRVYTLEKLPPFRAKIPKGVNAYLKQIYFDLAHSTSPIALKPLFEIVDIDHVMMGTDYQFSPDPEEIVRETLDGISSYDGFDDEARAKIWYKNALGLFPQLA